MIPYIAPQTGEPQRKALHANVRAPLVYVNVVVRNWEPWRRLGVAYIDNPGGTFAAYLDFPVSMGGYRFSADPADPICIHLFHTPTLPNQGLDMREQFRAGRGRLYTTNSRTSSARFATSSDACWDPPDSTSIAMSPQSPSIAGRTATPTLRRPCSTIRPSSAISSGSRANPSGASRLPSSDSGWDAYTNVAIDAAHRAVAELLA